MNSSSLARNVDPKQSQDELGQTDDGQHRYLAFKSGFVSLQERLAELMSRHQNQQQADDNKQDEQRLNGRQFATLQEFFQSKSSLKKQLEKDNQLRAGQRARVPIMRLNKDDWNVKCWEDRLSSYRLKSSKKQNSKQGRPNNDGRHDDCDQPNRLKKPEQQVRVFHGRIEDVAGKLDKVREGLPQDELIVRLERTKIRDRKTSHTYTDLLKRELAEGAHNRAKLMSSPTTSATHSSRSPLGRPIRRISQEDDDDDDDDDS